MPDKKSVTVEGDKSNTVVPHNKLADATAAAASHGSSKSVVATAGFEEAVENCKKKVEKIAKECRSANRKYRDFHFDLKWDGRHCLDGLTDDHTSDLNPAAILRVAVSIYW